MAENQSDSVKTENNADLALLPLKRENDVDSKLADSIKKIDIAVENVEIKSKTGKIYSITRQAAEMNQTIKDVLEHTEGGAVPVPQENKVLDFVFEYCTHFNGNPPDDDHYQKDGLDAWEKDFAIGRMSHAELLDVINVSCFLQNHSLKYCCFRALADKARGKTPQQIKEICCSDIDPTEEELKAIREKYTAATTDK